MKYVFILIALVCSAVTFAQKNLPTALAARLQGKTTVQEIMKEVDAYYEGEGKAQRSKIKDEERFEDDYVFWKRWEWWMLSHVDGEGEFVNINKKILMQHKTPIKNGGT